MATLQGTEQSTGTLRSKIVAYEHAIDLALAEERLEATQLHSPQQTLRSSVY
jgi:hypothetical protein